MRKLSGLSSINLRLTTNVFRGFFVDFVDFRGFSWISLIFVDFRGFFVDFRG